MNPVVNHILTNWKSSLQAVLSAVIALGVYFTAIPSGVIDQKPWASSPWLPALPRYCSA